ncbi:MAG TPA: protein kinase [Candidatus Udaeobacter sp.]
MATLIRACRRCGAKIFSDAPEGLCTGCALEAALGTFHGVVVPGADNVPVEYPETDHAHAEEHIRTAPVLAKLLGELGDYELLEEIGRGGQGVVFRARQKSLNRIVALKVIGLGQWATPAHLKRFRLEAEAAASLDHPCIVPIYEIGERDGQCYFSMKFIEGGQLDEVINHAPMSIRETVELVAKVARTVFYAHEHGILHRDIKPGNILLDKKGEPHLTDFGLARLVESESTVTRTVEVLGTPSYMAPEQAGGNNIKLTRATDVYGVGAVFYYLLTGNPPFAGGTTYETIKLLLETEPRPPRLWNAKVDRDLSTICQKCLEKDPECRYSSASAVADDLERWLKHEPIQARRTGFIGRGKKWLQRNPTAAMLVSLSLALIAALCVIVWKTDLFSHPPTAGIAVLPFQNLSDDREDASFADGIQDDLLTKLAKIATLKVISRTSVMGYRDRHNTRDIGKELGVSHVLEGSVRKTGAWLHINVQLIDARTDSHIWAEEYDRDVKEMFSVQSSIAQKVAAQVHAKISAAQRQAIERPPTIDLTAFDLYSRAKNLILGGGYHTGGKEDLLQAASLLNRAVTHDPMFFQAYCHLAWIHDHLYFFNFDRTPARLALAEAAIASASRLRPDSGEAHLARAENLYRGHRDFERASTELQLAGQTLSNDARVFELKGYIERRRSGANQEEALRNFQRAVELDPRNFFILQQTAISYDLLRRYGEEEAILDRALSLVPDAETKVQRAVVEFDWKGKTRPVHRAIDEIRVKDPAALGGVAESWLTCALAERDPVAATKALAVMDENSFDNQTAQFGPHFVEGLIARMTRDDAKAHSAFIADRKEQEKLLSADPDDARALCVLGLIDAALGRKDEAIRESRRAVELVPIEKDSIAGARLVTCLAITAAWVGDKDLSCQQLAAAVKYPNGPSYGHLKLMPFWDPLRGDPSFERIVASLAPR